jgi:hypothetical protein
MSSLAERQRMFIEHLLALGQGSSPAADKRWTHFADFVFFSRKAKLRRSLPKTTLMLKSAFDDIFEEFARSHPPVSTATNADLADFLRFSRAIVPRIKHVPAFAGHLMRFEAAIARVRAADEFPHETTAQGFPIELIATDFDFSALFEPGSGQAHPEPRKTRCVLWIDRQSGRLRVAELSSRSFSELRRMQKSGAPGDALLAWLGLENPGIDGRES